MNLNWIFNKKKYYLNKGQSCVNNNDHINAVKYFELYFKYEPDDVGILKKIGLAFAKNNKREYAVIYFSLYLIYRPNDVYILNERGAQYYFIGKNDKALEDLNNSRLIKKNQKTKKKDVYLFSSRALYFTFLEEYNKALEDINLAIKLEPKLSIHYEKRAEIYEKLKMANEAETDRKKASSIDKKNKSILENNYVNGFLEKLKNVDMDVALKSLESAIAEYPNNPVLLYYRAERCYYNSIVSGQFDSSYLYSWNILLNQAVSDLEKLIKIDPDYTNAKTLLKKTKIELAKVRKLQRS